MRLFSALRTTSLIVIFMLALASCGGDRALTKAKTLQPAQLPRLPDNSTIKPIWQIATDTKATVAIYKDFFLVTTTSGLIKQYGLDSGAVEHNFNSQLTSPLVSGVGVNATTIVAATSDGDIVALDRFDGTVKWRQKLTHAVSAAPILNDSIAIIRSIDGNVFGLNANNGEQVWALNRPVAGLSLGLDGTSLIADKGLITGFSNGSVLVNNIFNGNIFWEKRAFRPTGNNDIARLVDMDTPPILMNEHVVFNAFGRGLIAYRLRDGELKWRNDSLSPISAAAIKDDNLAVTESHSLVTVLNTKNGEINWQQNNLRDHQLSAPTFFASWLVVGGTEGNLFFLDPKDGNIVSMLTLDIGSISTIYSTSKGLLVHAASTGILVLLSSP